MASPASHVCGWPKGCVQAPQHGRLLSGLLHLVSGEHGLHCSEFWICKGSRRDLVCHQSCWCGTELGAWPGRGSGQRGFGTCKHEWNWTVATFRFVSCRYGSTFDANFSCPSHGRGLRRYHPWFSFFSRRPRAWWFEWLFCSSATITRRYFCGVARCAATICSSGTLCWSCAACTIRLPSMRAASRHVCRETLYQCTSLVS